MTDAEVNEDWSCVTAGLGLSSSDGMPGKGESVPDALGVTSCDSSDSTCIKLFDSRCTSHISPYCDDFTKLAPINPKLFCAANKRPFSTTAKGELVINVPHSITTSNLHLTKVFYSPKVSYMLVSVGKLDDAGFHVAFGEGKCIITGKDSTTIGDVPKDDGGLYHLQH